MQSDLPFSDTLTFLKMQKAPAECFHKAEGFVYHFRRRYPLLLGGEKYVFRHHLTGKIGEHKKRRSGDLKAMQILEIFPL